MEPHAVGRLARSPTVVLALVLLLLNDHVLKQAVAGRVTGKLSDVAGLVLLPALLVIIYESVTRRPPRGPVAWGISGAVGIGFAAVQLLPAADRAWEHAAGAGQWLLRGLQGPFVASVNTMDATDLLALPALAVVPLLLRDRPAQPDRPRGRPDRPRDRRERLRTTVVVVLGALACAATSPAPESASWGGPGVFVVLEDRLRLELAFAVEAAGNVPDTLDAVGRVRADVLALDGSGAVAEVVLADGDPPAFACGTELCTARAAYDLSIAGLDPPLLVRLEPALEITHEGVAGWPITAEVIGTGARGLQRTSVDGALDVRVGPEGLLALVNRGSVTGSVVLGGRQVELAGGEAQAWRAADLGCDDGCRMLVLGKGVEVWAPTLVTLPSWLRDGPRPSLGDRPALDSAGWAVDGGAQVIGRATVGVVAPLAEEVWLGIRPVASAWRLDGPAGVVEIAPGEIAWVSAGEGQTYQLELTDGSGTEVIDVLAAARYDGVAPQAGVALQIQE